MTEHQVLEIFRKADGIDQKKNQKGNYGIRSKAT